MVKGAKSDSILQMRNQEPRCYQALWPVEVWIWVILFYSQHLYLSHWLNCMEFLSWKTAPLHHFELNQLPCQRKERCHAIGNTLGHGDDMKLRLVFCSQCLFSRASLWVKMRSHSKEINQKPVRIHIQPHTVIPVLIHLFKYLLSTN